jgi:hypothetical protein
MDQVPGAPPAALEVTRDDIFIVYDDRRVAKRGKPGTPQAKTWVSLEPGIVVLDNADLTAITVEVNGVRAH